MDGNGVYQDTCGVDVKFSLYTPPPVLSPSKGLLMEEAKRFERAQSLVAAGDFESARKEFHELAQAAEDAESRINYLFGEILALIQLGRTQEARELLKIARLLYAAVDEAHARGDLIEVQLDSSEDKWDRVLPGLERMLKRYGNFLNQPQLRDVYEDVQLRRGMRLASLGRFSEALPLLQEAVSYAPFLALGDLYRELGCCYIDTGDYERASQMLTKALDSGLDDASAASAHYSLGTLLMRKQAHARALEEFGLAEKHAETAETSKAWKRELYKAMAVSFHELGMDDEAKRFYQLGLD